MNEIFGEENFVEQVVWKKRYGAGGGTKGFAKLHEYILLFTKRPLQNIEAPLTEEQIDEYKNKDEKYHKRGGYITQPLATSSKGERTNLSYTISHNGNEIKPEPGSRWLWSKEKFDKAYLDNEIIINETNGKFSVRVKQYLKDEFGKIRNGKPLSIQIGTYNQEGTKEVAEVLGKKGIFDFPKPITLVKYLLSFIVNDDLNRDGIYLDFFGGSGTTAQAVLELNKENEGNRKFILVQLPEKCDESSEAYKAGYKTIADIAKERIRRVIKKIENEKQKAEKKKGLFADKGNEDNQSNHGSDNGFKVFKLSSSNFKIWRGDEITEENLKAQLDAFTNPVREGSEKENMLYELILKAGYLLTDKVEAKGNYYSINDGELIIALEEMNQKLIETIIYAKPKKVITLDKLFIGNDQLKTNTVLQMRDAEIDFKTI